MVQVTEQATQCGSSSTVGFDCTGLTLYAVYQATGNVVLPHGDGIANFGTLLPASTPLLPGDILLFGGTTAAYVHVGIYAANGYMWDANTSYWIYPDGVHERLLSAEEADYSLVGVVRF